jgi:hypothetical protein
MGGSESKSEGNTKIGTSGNPQRMTQRRIPADLNPLKNVRTSILATLN